MVVVLFALGLMAKPMLVTLPFVLLLLDYWPLGGWSHSHLVSQAPAWEPATGVPKPELGNEINEVNDVNRRILPTFCRLVTEKLPLLALSAASCVVTSLAQGESWRRHLEILPLSSRAANALVSSVAYLRQFFWPVELAAYHPHAQNGLPTWQVVGAALLLAGITAGVVACWRCCPWLSVGWFWYLGMLVPVIGLVQVGQQAMADRYTYLPQIGLAIALAWQAKRALASWPYRRVGGRHRVGVGAGGPDGMRPAASVLFGATARHSGITLWPVHRGRCSRR